MSYISVMGTIEDDSHSSVRVDVDLGDFGYQTASVEVSGKKVCVEVDVDDIDLEELLEEMDSEYIAQALIDSDYEEYMKGVCAKACDSGLAGMVSTIADIRTDQFYEGFEEVDMDKLVEHLYAASDETCDRITKLAQIIKKKGLGQ